MDNITAYAGICWSTLICMGEIEREGEVVGKEKTLSHLGQERAESGKFLSSKEEGNHAHEY